MLFKIKHFILFVGLFFLLDYSVALAESWQVVTRDDSVLIWLDEEQVRDLFMSNRVKLWQVVDSDNSVMRNDFYQQVLGFSASRWRAHWSKLVFTGQGSPPPQLNHHDVLIMLQQSDQVITYLPLGLPLPIGVKRVYLSSEMIKGD